MTRTICVTHVKDDIPVEGVVIIYCGAPGQGKSTIAKAVEERGTRNKLHIRTFSADNAFISEDGTYEFVPWGTGPAHAHLQHQFTTAIQGTEFDIIQVDNTNLRPWEMLHYKREARLYHWAVIVCDLRNGPLYGSIHGVAKKQALTMLSNADSPLPTPHLREVHDSLTELYNDVVTVTSGALLFDLLPFYVEGFKDEKNYDY